MPHTPSTPEGMDMLTHLDTYLKNFDPGEPLLQAWALDLIDAMAGGIDPEAADAVEARLVSSEFMAALFGGSDSRLISRAISSFSPERFRPVVEELETLWQVDINGDHYNRGLAQVIAEVDPELASRLFKGNIQDCAGMDAGALRLKLPQIAAAIEKLPPESAHALAHAMIEAFETFAKTASGDTLAPDFIFDLAWQYGHPKVIDYLHDLFAGQVLEGGRQARWDLVHLAFGLGDASAEYHLVCDRIEKVATFELADLTIFYKAEADLIGFDEAMRQVGLRRYGEVAGLVARFGPLLPDQRLTELLTRLVEDQGFIGGLHKKKQRPYFYALILSLLLRSQRRKSLDFKAISLDAALGILAAEATLLPHKEALMTWLADKDPATVIQQLRTRLSSSEDIRSASTLIALAGRFKDDALVEALMAIPPGDHYDEDCDLAVEQALLTSGEIYFDLADHQWDQLNPEQQLRALQVAERALGQSAALIQRARQCVEAHFDLFWQLDREKLLALCPLLGVDCRKQLEPFVSKNQSHVDRAWLTLSLLNGDRSDTVMALLKAHQLAEAEMRDLLETAVAPKTPLDAVPTHIDTELTCSGCGETFVYRLERIWLNPEEMGDYYPAQEFPCLGCKRLTDFSLSEEGMYAISMQTLELNISPSPSDFEAQLDKSPFEILPRVISYGAERRIGDAIDACRQTLSRQPEDPRAFFELGNIYVNLDQRIKARQCFETVIALAPDAIEAYLMLAQMAIDKEDYADARGQLERGKACLAQPRLLMGAEVSQDQMVHFYRLLAERLDKPAPDLSDLFTHVEPPVLREEKNDPRDP